MFPKLFSLYGEHSDEEPLCFFFPFLNARLLAEEMVYFWKRAFKYLSRHSHL